MSLLKAFPPGRPSPRARPVVAAALVALLAMVAVLLPLVGTADARSAAGSRADTQARKKQQPAPTKPRIVGQPPRNYVIPQTSFFSFPNRSKKERMAIRNRVLYTIQSVWGGPRDSLGSPLPTNGTIRIATWSFDDWVVAKALWAAHKRGVSVQVIAARAPNRDHAAWRWLRKRLGSRLSRPGYPSTGRMFSFARECRGSCRGPGGTPHSKYFMFDNVGAAHVRKIVVQTSMNLTQMAYWGQWNQAQVSHTARVYDDFTPIFVQSRMARPVAQPYHLASIPPYMNYFFPRPHATAAQDPVMQNLNPVACAGALNGRRGRTMIRIVQYAIYGERGVWIAKKLRQLWDAGCDVAIVYAVTSRPVLSILRNRSGRGPVPMKQSVIKDRYGHIIKYNHSKWMLILGRFGSSRAAYITLSGSANWSNLAFSDDEQMQRVSSRSESLRYLSTFAKTWRQKSSRRPTAAPGRVAAFGRMMVPLGDGEPTFGKGIYRYLPED